MNALVRIMDFEIRGRSFFSGQLVNINADLLFGANQLLMLPLVLSVTQQLAGARMTIDQRLGLVNRNRQIAASLNVVIVSRMCLPCLPTSIVLGCASDWI